MPYFIYIKRFLLLLTAVAGVSLLMSSSVSAAGEKYTWANSSRTTITATGGAYAQSSNNMSGRFVHQGSDTGDPNIIELRNTSSTAVAGAEPGKCTVSILVDKSKNKVYPTLMSCTNQDGYIDREKSDSISLSNDVSVAAYVDTEINNARVNATYAAFNGTLDRLMSRYYESVPNPPCSSQGCSEGPWKNFVYQCWNSARSNAASSARYGGSSVNTTQLTKELFASCIAGSIDGVNSQGVLSLIGGVDVATVNRAASDAQSAVESDRAAAEEENVGDEDTTACAVDGIGWVVCPVMTFLGNATDTAFNFLSTTFLETRSDIISNDGVRAAWSTMRNIANIAFVIVFLIIIYSQITSAGISNYGVKKMLPRLVVAAILVNLSYFICLIAVDISNILGYTLKGFFDGTFSSIRDTLEGGGGDAGSDAAVQVGAIIIGILATAAGLVTIALAASMPVILAALLALLLIVLILVGRTALIIILTIISPLAFVAYLLPNTEQWFKKWFKLYSSLLLLFPIIAVVFGASSLAAGILNDVATRDANNPDILLQLVAVGVATVPLFTVPSLLKNSLNAVGSLGTKLSGMSTKATGRVGGKVKDTSKLGQLQKYRQQQSQIRRAKILGGVDPRRGGRANPLNWGARAQGLFNRSAVSGSFGTQSAAMGAGLVAEEEEKAIKNASALLLNKSLTNGELNTLALGGDTAKKLAADKGLQLDDATHRAVIRRVMSENNFADNEKIVMRSGALSGAVRKEIVAGMQSNGLANKADYLGGDMADRVMQGQIGRDESGAYNAALAEKHMNDAAVSRISSGKLSAQALVGQDHAALSRFSDVVNGSAETTDPSKVATEQFKEKVSELRKQAATAQSDPELSRQITGQKSPHIKNIAGSSPTLNSSANQTNQSFDPNTSRDPNTVTFRGGEEVSGSGLIIPRDRK